MAKKRTITFIGAGNMAEAMVAGLLRSGVYSSSSVSISDVRRSRLSCLKREYGIKAHSGNAAAAAKADIVVLAVKPGQMRAVLGEIGRVLSPKQLVISIAAGITTGFIEKGVGKRIAVVRAMPNMPLVAGAGATALSKGRHASKSDMRKAQRVFDASGKVFTVPEKLMDCVTAVSGSGPAYFFLLCELLGKAAARLGIPRGTAEELARQTLHGAGLMLSADKRTAEELRACVTSPGGTTQAAVEHLTKKGFQNIFTEAVKAARRRAGELTR
ncbi:MAG: pyrroline-5-carboxylate reductase [Endomicrobiales bacterium]|nr:pyrroline-5-carboxylate reductase [Endomicrobiales bacterium]